VNAVIELLKTWCTAILSWRSIPRASPSQARLSVNISPCAHRGPTHPGVRSTGPVPFLLRLRHGARLARVHQVWGVGWLTGGFFNACVSIMLALSF
jgi:hypothetical protein